MLACKFFNGRTDYALLLSVECVSPDTVLRRGKEKGKGKRRKERRERELLSTKAAVKKNFAV